MGRLRRNSLSLLVSETVRPVPSPVVPGCPHLTGDDEKAADYPPR